MAEAEKRPSPIWWLLAIQGVAAITYGLLAFVWPQTTLDVLVVIFGVYAMIGGVSAAINAFGRRDETRMWWLELFNGLIGIGAGLVALFAPGLAALAILALLIAWMLVIGISALISAFRDREVPSSVRMSIGLSGAISVLVAVLLIGMGPGSGEIAMIWMFGIHAIAYGACLLFAGWQLRKLSPR